MAKFFFSQSSVKDLEREETCPFRWKSQWLDRIIPFASNEDMDKGKYFEQAFIGAGAIAEDTVTDLPRLNNGKKSTDHQRIDAQVERAKRLFDPNDPEFLGFKLGRIQAKLEYDNRQGTIDIEAFDQDGQPWIIDVKLTKDLTSDRSQYGWGNDWSMMDLMQLIHYEDLYEKETGIRPRIAILVFDYSPQKRIVFGELKVSNKKRAEKEIRFKAAEEAVNLYNQHGWIKTPNLKECEGCPLTCDVRANKSTLIKKIIEY